MQIFNAMQSWSLPVEIISSSERDWYDYMMLIASCLNVVLIVAGLASGYIIWTRQQNRMKVSKIAEEMLFTLIDYEQVIAQARHIGRYDVQQEISLIYKKRYEYLCENHALRTKLLIVGKKIQYLIPEVELIPSLRRLTEIWDDHLKYFDLLSIPDARELNKEEYEQAMSYFVTPLAAGKVSTVISNCVENANVKLKQYIRFS